MDERNSLRGEAEVADRDRKLQARLRTTGSGDPVVSARGHDVVDEPACSRQDGVGGDGDSGVRSSSDGSSKCVPRYCCSKGTSAATHLYVPGPMMIRLGAHGSGLAAR